jgi:hypothetical protein
MGQQTSNMKDDLEQLRRGFDEFRNTQPLRSRLPESLWATATELATGTVCIPRRGHCGWTTQV